eukprot:COSAG01_NODE_9463_length_2440_cov_1.660402_4_plen_35_part_01
MTNEGHFSDEQKSDRVRRDSRLRLSMRLSLTLSLT